MPFQNVGCRLRRLSRCRSLTLPTRYSRQKGHWSSWMVQHISHVPCARQSQWLPRWEENVSVKAINIIDEANNLEHMYPIFESDTSEGLLQQYRHWTQTNLAETLQRALEADGTQLLFWGMVCQSLRSASSSGYIWIAKNWSLEELTKMFDVPCSVCSECLSQE